MSRLCQQLQMPGVEVAMVARGDAFTALAPVGKLLTDFSDVVAVFIVKT